jgi:crotonobetainyl-CoA:carnitine CoA-transferase CaiB-like acyl-CoA transferase
MLDAAMVLMTPTVVSQLRGGSTPGQMLRPTMARFNAMDRPLFIGALHRKWFERLCEIVGAPELSADPRFADPRSQAEHADELTDELERRLATRPAAEWERELTGAGIPAGVVRTVPEIVADPHLQSRGILEQVGASNGEGPMTLVGSAIRSDHDGPAFQGPVPRLGEHTDEILAHLGYAATEIGQLKADGIVQDAAS